MEKILAKREEAVRYKHELQNAKDEKKRAEESAAALKRSEAMRLREEQRRRKDQALEDAQRKKEEEAKQLREEQQKDRDRLRELQESSLQERRRREESDLTKVQKEHSCWGFWTSDTALVSEGEFSKSSDDIDYAVAVGSELYNDGGVHVFRVHVLSCLSSILIGLSCPGIPDLHALLRPARNSDITPDIIQSSYWESTGPVLTAAALDLRLHVNCGGARRLPQQRKVAAPASKPVLVVQVRVDLGAGEATFSFCHRPHGNPRDEAEFSPWRNVAGKLTGVSGLVAPIVALPCRGDKVLLEAEEEPAAGAAAGADKSVQSSGEKQGSAEKERGNASKHADRERAAEKGNSSVEGGKRGKNPAYALAESSAGAWREAPVLHEQGPIARYKPQTEAGKDIQVQTLKYALELSVHFSAKKQAEKALILQAWFQAAPIPGRGWSVRVYGKGLEARRSESLEDNSAALLEKYRVRLQAESRVQAREEARRMAKAVRKMSLSMEAQSPEPMSGFGRTSSVEPQDLNDVSQAEIEAFLVANATSELYERFAAFGSDEYRGSAMGARATSLDMHEYLLLLKHIRVSPQRLSKTTAVSIFEDVNSGVGGEDSGMGGGGGGCAVSDDDEHELSFDEFYECMRRIGQRLALMNATNTQSEISAASQVPTVHREILYGHLVPDKDDAEPNSPTLFAHLQKIKVWDKSRHEVVALVAEDSHLSPLRGKPIANRRSSLPEPADLAARSASCVPPTTHRDAAPLTTLQAGGFILNSAPQWQQHPQQPHKQPPPPPNAAAIKTSAAHLKPVALRKAKGPGPDARPSKAPPGGDAGRRERGFFERTQSGPASVSLAVVQLEPRPGAEPGPGHRDHATASEASSALGPNAGCGPGSKNHAPLRGSSDLQLQKLPAIFRAPAYMRVGPRRDSGLGIRRSTSCPPEPPSFGMNHRPAIGALSSLKLGDDDKLAFHYALVKADPLHVPPQSITDDDYIHPHVRTTSPTQLTIQGLMEAVIPPRPSASHLHHRPDCH